MDENFAETLIPKDEPVQYDDEFETELKPDILDIDEKPDILVINDTEINASSDAPPDAEELNHPAIKEETDDFEGCSELQPAVFSLDDRTFTSDEFKGVPEAMQFVDLADVPDISTFLVKVEETDPLFGLKLEADSCFADAQQSTTDNVIKASSCILEPSPAPVTRPCFVRLVRLVIPGDKSIDDHQLMNNRPLKSHSSTVVLSQFQSSNTGTIQAATSVEKSPQGIHSRKQRHTNQDQPDYSATSLASTPASKHNFLCEQCFSSISNSSYLTEPTDMPTSDRPKKCVGCHKMFVNKCQPEADLESKPTAQPCQYPERDKNLTHEKRLNSRLQVPEVGAHPSTLSQSNSCLTKETRPNSTVRVRNVGRHKCSRCGKCFKRRCQLTRHFRLHTGERPFKCTECGKSYPFRGTLNQHMTLHRGDRPYQCSHCDRTFTSKSNFADHLRIHSSDRPFQCPQCKKGFKVKYHLKRHFESHNGERPFKCSDCDKTFCRDYNLVIHARSHTGERPYQCYHCEEKFVSKCHLKKHVKRHNI